MPTFSTYNAVQKAIAVFNTQAYNAGFEFKVYSSETSCLYIQASFDFGYYVDVDIECREVLFTNIASNASWPDAWHADQMFLLTDDEVKEMMASNAIEPETDKPCFGIVFNIIGREKYNTMGTVICTSLYINWRRPGKNEAYENL